VLHCHAGCSTESVAQAAGLSMSDLFYEQKKPPDNGGKREFVAEYIYTDINGKPLHKSVRYSDKSFIQRRPDPNSQGKWLSGLGGIETVIYKLPKVIAAIKAEKPIFIVEGEKDVDNLEKLGFTVTTNPMGAGKWQDYHSDYLKGATVYIIPDNDKTGKEHVEKVAKSLKGKAKSIKMIDLTKELPDLPNKGDVTDFFKIINEKAEGLTRFNKLVNGAVEFEEGTGTKPKVKRMSEVESKTLDYLIDPYIPLGRLTRYYGLS